MTYGASLEHRRRRLRLQHQPGVVAVRPEHRQFRGMNMLEIDQLYAQIEKGVTDEQFDSIARKIGELAFVNLLDAGDPLGRAAGAGLPARAHPPAGREPDRLPRHLGQGRPHPERLPPPRRLAVLRPQRRRRPALRLPRLEVRRRRRLRRHALEPAESNFKSKVKRGAYPTHERNGIIWAYMGPRTDACRRCPTSRPTCRRRANVSVLLRECNWMQALEGEMDTVHAGFLHYGSESASTQPGPDNSTTTAQRPAKFDGRDGLRHDLRRLPPGRGGQLLLALHPDPLALLPHDPRRRDGRRRTHGRLRADGRRAHDVNGHLHLPTALELQPEFAVGFTTDWYSLQLPMLRATPAKDYLRRQRYSIDRRRSANFSYTGIPGGRAQDRAITSSTARSTTARQGGLGQTELGIIRTRKILLDTAKKFVETGETPPAPQPAATPTCAPVRSSSPEGANRSRRRRSWQVPPAGLLLTGNDGHPVAAEQQPAAAVVWGAWRAFCCSAAA